MSTSVVDQFWARVASDAVFKSAFRSSLSENPTPQELARFASESGYEASAEDFLDHARAKAAAPASADDVELSEELLETVAGGGSADSYASDPLEVDIYTTWETKPGGTGKGNSPQNPSAAPPP